MTKGFIESLHLPNKYSGSQSLVEDIKKAYEKNTILFEKRPGYKSPEIKVQHFKPLIDKIDYLLGSHFGLKDEQIDFIVNYDLKYRMGRDNNEEDD
jgi:hypothetical protein